MELTSAGAERWRHEIAAALLALPGVRGVYERSDVDIRTRRGWRRGSVCSRGEEPPESFAVHEDGSTFLIDVRTGHKTGFYLDQRESRGVVASWPRAGGC